MKKFLYIFVSLLILGLVGFLLLKNAHSPQYSGELRLDGLTSEVEVYFDAHGVPHIYGENAEDTYQAMGFLHAQDRIFQMDMMRRVGTGTLAELLGEDVLDIDKFFRTLGIPQHAAWSTEVWNQEGPSEWKSATEAYIKGVNQFIQQGNLPLEYRLLGSKPREFTINDVHGIAGYMAFSFAMAVRTDPLITKIVRNLGPDYTRSLSIHTLPEHFVIPNHYPERAEETGNVIVRSEQTISFLDKLPVPMLEGSNAWVIAPERTASGEVLFCNDTHIGFAQPSVWFEAHLEYPGFSFYGNHLAGLPFGLVGHSKHHSIGLTMFENDDQDFYEEQLNPDNPLETRYGDGFVPLTVREELIPVKGTDPVAITIRESIHGPIMNEVVPEIARLTANPVASWWVYVLEPSKAMEALWKLNHAQTIQDVEAAAPLIHAPGLNIMYGDKAGNIAWWAVARLPIRPNHVNSKVFLDGSNPADEPQGWIPFHENPMSINPPSGFVASANNQPDTLSNGSFYPGYYYPGDRWNRIAKTVSARNDWTTESIKNLQLEAINENHPLNAQSMIATVGKEAFGPYTDALKALERWSGNHDLDAVAPTVYYKWLYHTLHGMMADELGEEDFSTFLTTFLYIRSVPTLIRSEDSKWWDHIETDAVETKKDIVEAALEKTLQELADQLGKKDSEWLWKKVVVLEHPHPLGAKKPLDKIFNVKTVPVTANEESVNKLPFKLNGDGIYKVNSGPAMRIIVDFADVDGAISVLPTGQSGNVFSKYYKDQAHMFATGNYRPMLMNAQEIKEKATSTLTILRE
ncbi:penicillin acylase family protein [Mongoliitalea daihaiensis]|uniref:penicillin acylase family protein n=1 Tax=Mongoliitalea daihaiensis TaxID=2782006 RepID=UPI001F177DE1|nr:penicillin acylase family protein [Mongoliitalea daihaiensis]UJP64117.1 penicillin acylase family protein [Mongoliitalea daihaiensis]